MADAAGAAAAGAAAVVAGPFLLGGVWSIADGGSQNPALLGVVEVECRRGADAVRVRSSKHRVIRQ